MATPYYAVAQQANGTFEAYYSDETGDRTSVAKGQVNAAMAYGAAERAAHAKGQRLTFARLSGNLIVVNSK